jgi:hypothetical protein
MKRYLLSLAILVVGLFWVGVGAPVWGGESLLEPSQPKPEAPDIYDPEFFPYDAERDAGVMKMLGQNKAVAAMTAGRELGRDLWIQMSYVYEDSRADNSGPYPIDMADIYFDPPVSYSGEVPVTSKRCAGIIDPAEDDPCQTARREFSGKTEHRTFSDVQQITAVVYLDQGVVADVLYTGPSEWSLAEIKARYAKLFPNGVPK